MNELIIKSIEECLLCGDAAEVNEVEFVEDTLEVTYICNCGSETKKDITIIFT